MTKTQMLDQAIEFCLKAHDGQLRKGTAIPYAVHPVATAIIVGHYTKKESIIVAALLHDVVEDTEYSIEYIGERFSDEVASLVAQLSETKTSADGKKLPWIDRKNSHLKSLFEYGSREALMIKVADHIHNLRSMEGVDLEQARSSFNSTVEQRLWYSEEVLKIASKKNVPRGLLKQLKRSIKTFI